ncbi:flagellar operon protein (TIGR03826 family) [Paenibacillus shirakamiensis]|uniref:Flagellar operon protein (TIGR03826 family) n=1 Tax=Paenibacillus shirakamiensis TaxID=1265935 RepID=A0ABS4JJB3_9BACL|nr:TIGR03826 family flagellar region protein [Paenibacillus shirakamiensis]MBP2001782.1 flagellar operon protein (TIGR03826 family) [Paenibacillus shirakamiensis]
MNLDNCPRCGKLYVKNFKNLCSACIKDIENEYEICHSYLYEHKKVSLHELSEATGVSTKQIMKFIKEGRISIADYPELMYPCEVCGTSITTGNMCDNCRSRLSRDLSAATEAKESGQNEGNGAYGAVERFRRD